MKTTSFFLLLIFAFPLFGQECDCLKALQFLEHTFEENLASYQHQVIEYKRQEEYNAHKAAINTIAKQIHSETDCIGLVSKYISFFRDEHLSIYYKDEFYKFESYTDTTGVIATYGNGAVLSPENSISKNPNLEGIWYYQNGSFEINIISNPSHNREWAGIMAKGDGLLWKKGQIKIELSPFSENKYHCIYWYNNRVPKYYVATLSDSALQIGRDFTYYRNQPNTSIQKYSPSSVFEFKALSEKTNYLRIPDFDPEYFTTIDSLIAANLKTLTQKPNLIIDLRNNGGGGDRGYQALLPLIFDTTLVSDPISASVWVSPDNFKDIDDNYLSYALTHEDSLFYINYIENLRPQVGKFSDYSFSQSTLDTVYPSIKKVAIIINRNCASTTEGFAFLAKQSKKVTLYGENSTGAISYGDWREALIPNLPIGLTLTTKKMVFADGTDIESIGVTPHISLEHTKESEWINQIKTDLENTTGK